MPVKTLTAAKAKLTATRRGWMVKQEPEAYSWHDFVRDSGTAWTGVRNHQAKQNLQAMRGGDRVFFYHSISEKAVIGIAEVRREAYPDPTAQPEEPWICVDLAPLGELPRPVALAEIKGCEALGNLPLLRQSRLSVLPVDANEWEAILLLAGLS